MEAATMEKYEVISEQVFGKTRCDEGGNGTGSKIKLELNPRKDKEEKKWLGCCYEDEFENFVGKFNA